jgi:hypothetical protein
MCARTPANIVRQCACAPKNVRLLIHGKSTSLIFRDDTGTELRAVTEISRN